MLFLLSAILVLLIVFCATCLNKKKNHLVQDVRISYNTLATFLRKPPRGATDASTKGGIKIAQPRRMWKARDRP